MWRQKTNEVTWDVPKMLGWKKMSSERVFYYNRVTGARSTPRLSYLSLSLYTLEHQPDDPVRQRIANGMGSAGHPVHVACACAKGWADAVGGAASLECSDTSRSTHATLQ